MSHNIGAFYYENRDFYLAIEYYQKSYEYFQKLKEIKRSISSLRNIANSYQKIKNEEKAIEYGKKALNISKKLDDDIEIINSYNLLGNLSIYNANLQLAKLYFKKSLAHQEIIEQDEHLAYNLYSLVLICIDNKEIDEAINYCNQLENLSNPIDNKYVLNLFKIASSRMLLIDSSYKSFQNASRLLNEVINLDDISSIIKTYAYLVLTDLLLQQIDQYESEFEDIKSTLAKLLAFSRKFNIHSITVKTLILMYKVDKLSGIKEGNNYLQEANSLMILYGFHNLKSNIDDELKKDTDNIDRIDLIKSSRELLIPDICHRNYMLDIV